MKTIKLSFLLIFFGLFVNAQSKYETEMSKALEEWKNAKTPDETIKVIQHFDRIAKVESTNWIPLYYSTFIKILSAFESPKEIALQQISVLEPQIETLEKLSPNNAEILNLKGLAYTVKVAKDPMSFGQSLSPVIVSTYESALKIDPNNPRAKYLLAQYNMGGAKFWGKDPKTYCTDVEKAKILIESEQKKDFEPKWGKDQIDSILEETCKK